MCSHCVDQGTAWHLVDLRVGARRSRDGAKWVARLGVEHQLGLEDLRYALEAVTALPHHPAHARRNLVDICARYELRDTVGLHQRR